MNAAYQQVDSTQFTDPNSESSGESHDIESDRRQQDFEDEMNGGVGPVPGGGAVANNLRQMRLAAIQR